MAITGIGIDLVEVERIRLLLGRHGERFKARTFTEEEIRYCDGCADPAMHYAARFAAKEAGAKALGTGFAEGVSWMDIEVVRNAAGRPELRLHAGAGELAALQGVVRCHVSLTHTKEQATAQVVLESGV
jgi:holo-[acyl-carrier protein] synthase